MLARSAARSIVSLPPAPPSPRRSAPAGLSSLTGVSPRASAFEVSERESTIGLLDELSHARLCLHERSGRRAKPLDSLLEQSERIVERHFGALELPDDGLDACDVGLVAHLCSSTGRGVVCTERAVARTVPSCSRRSK